MPNNWKTYKLSELTELITKGTTPSTYGFGFTDDGINFIKSESTNYDGRLDESSFVKVSIEAHEKLKRSQLKENDILFSMAGAYLGKTGIVCKNHLPANTNQANGIIRVNQAKAIPKFVALALRNPLLVNYVNASGGQSAQPNINLTDIGNLEIALPPLPEQKSIASILSAIDDKIENNLAINKTLEEMAMALYKHWFVDFGPFQDGEFVESELGRIPKGWEVMRLDDIITVKRGGSPRPIQDFLAPSGLPWVKISDATASNSPYLMETKEFIKEEGLRKTVLLKKGSLILSNSASPGIPKFLELDACIHDGWLHFPEINRFGKYLLFLTFLRIKEELIQKGNGSVFTNLKTDILKSQLVTLPPKEIEEKINFLIKSFFKKIRENSIENQTLTQLRDTLLPKLISGELRLKEFVSSDK
jgi:type I restriction enzyme S subunit